jgi:hypothetical protein
MRHCPSPHMCCAPVPSAADQAAWINKNTKAILAALLSGMRAWRVAISPRPYWQKVRCKTDDQFDSRLGEASGGCVKAHNVWHTIERGRIVF